MSSSEEPMDGFSTLERIRALRIAKTNLETDLKMFIEEEIAAFELVKNLDAQLRIHKTPELEERRRQKFNFACSLKWNIIGQKKEIERCTHALTEEENKLASLGTLNVQTKSNEQ